MPIALDRLGRRQEKLDKAAQHINAREEARAKTAAAQRKAANVLRIRVEQEMGRIAERIGLLDIPEDELRGALYTLEEGIKDDKTRTRWKAKASEHDAAAATAREKRREPLMISFQEVLLPIDAAALKKIGFKHNRVIGWYGEVVLDDAQAIARARNGVLRRLDGTAVSIELEEPLIAAE